MNWVLSGSFRNIDRALRTAAKAGDPETIKEIQEELEILASVSSYSMNEALDRKNKSDGLPQSRRS